MDNTDPYKTKFKEERLYMSTDPCYNRDVWCRMTDVKIRNGVYTCIAWHHKNKGTFDNGEPYCYDVIGIIGIYLDGVIPCQKEMKKIGDIGVDAGLAGFFHNKPDYEQIEPHKKAQSNKWWKEKIRQTLQINPMHFTHDGRGLWSLNRNAA